MTPPQAIRFHQDKLQLDLSLIANGAKNPGAKTVYYLRELWLKQNHGSVGGNSMFQCIKDYSGKNPKCNILLEGDDKSFTAVLVTEFMLRVHKEFRESCEVVFVDTTSHVDQLNTAVTVLLCAGPAGAAPLGLIFSSSQDEAGYHAGMCLQNFHIFIIPRLIP